MPSVGLAVFPAIILGGLDSFEGAFLGAFIVGIISSVVSVTLGGQWQDPIAYLALLAVLLLRPRGLFGSREIVRI
jgi:branched-chain amino acid transport system permease protein